MSQGSLDFAQVQAAGVRATFFEPSAVLKDRVKFIAHVENEADLITALPATGAMLSFLLNDSTVVEEAGGARLCSATCVGIHGSARRYRYAGRTSSVLVRLTPQGAACLVPRAHELTNTETSIDDLLSYTLVRRVEAKLRRARSAREAVACVESFLSTLRKDSDPLVDEAISAISLAKRGLALGGLARSLGLSERQFERRFIAQVGVSARTLLGLYRFERAVALTVGALPLAAVAHEAGYADQPHFIREFSRLSGMTPLVFRNQRMSESFNQRR